MPQVRRLPFRGSMTFGRGVNSLTGEVVGKALKINSTEKAVSGQEASYDVQIIETHDELLQSVGLSVEAGGRYGLFSAEGKFGYAEKSSFNSQSTFVVASCRVQNAFEMIDQVELLPEAKLLLEKPDQFKTTFGNSFVRGLQTGGEFFAIIQITSTDQKLQKDLSASLQAEYQGLVASGSFKTSFNTSKTSGHSESKIAISVYQRAGADEQISFTQDADEVLRRLKDFPKIARQNPAGYEAEIADYNTLALPAVNYVEIENRELALQDCARLRLKYMTIRNDVEFAQSNSIFFEGLPAGNELTAMHEAYSRAVNLVMRHAAAIAGREAPPAVFDITAADPSLHLPLVNFQRKNVPPVVPVPNLVGLPVAAAKTNLQQLGLQSDSQSIAVAENSGKSLDVVTAQEPAPGVSVPAGSRVRLTYNYVPSKRFPWAVKATTHINPNMIRRVG